MSTNSNVYSQGGGGPLYEFEVDSAYFINFLIGGGVPGLNDSNIIEFRQQSGSLGYKTDDLLLKCLDINSIEHIVLFQVKHNLTISENDDEFQKLLKEAWLDFKNASLFNYLRDRIYLIKSNLTLNEKNDLKQLLNWAKLKATFEDFQNEFLKINKKEKYFNLFKTVILQTDKDVTDVDLFNFFKCFDILEYDFGNIASTSKAHFLTLIELAKSENASSAIQIWNDVLAFISNSDSNGGLFNPSNLPIEMTSLFNKTYYNPTVKKLKKLSQQNFEIIQFIENTIGGICLNREDIVQDAVTKLNTNRILIISGEPGAGKSAIAKMLLETIYQTNSGYVLAFKADELADKNLRDIFRPYNIDLTIKEIFSHFPLLQENIIYIDSAEKLLEGDGIGLKQLLSAINDIANVKLILSCRSINLNLIERKFFHTKVYEKLEVALLDDEELNILEKQIPAIRTFKKNTRILPLIKNPKYLDFAVKSIPTPTDDFSEMNEIEFSNQLWEAIIENKLDANFDGFPIRRSNLFIELAVKRAKMMKPFIALETSDHQVLAKLEKDNVIIKSPTSDTYAPSHDVLEDWALVRFVSKHFSDIKNEEEFFNQLGTEPAMRRAYRLWVQNALKQKEIAKIDFFTNNIKSSKIERFWKDESLVALLNSDYCKLFFEKNFNLLKENNWNIFFWIIHVLRTACREKSNTSKDFKFFVPTGYGWIEIIKRIKDNITEIPEGYHNLIVNVISDWSNTLYISEKVPEGTREAALIILYLLENNFLKNSEYSYDDKNVERCLCLVFDLCGGAIPEVEEILNKAIKESQKDETNSNWIDTRYYSKILTLSLSGLKAGNLARYLPELIITIAKEKWYRKPKKRTKRTEGLLSFISEKPNRDDVNYHFGLAEKYDMDYFPASAYQTPILWLLRNHPYKTIDFICELINYSTEKYLASDFSKDDGCMVIELTLYDNSKIIQKGSSVLWSMYRGTGKVTPYLLQSVLMALEYYLLEVAECGESFKDYFQQLLHILYTKSKSVATTAVISSVCQAYPLMVDDKLLPLFTHRKLICWDVSRFTDDFHPFNLMSNNEIFDKERVKSDKLPHRLKNTPGIKGFIVDYCFNIRALNKQVFEILDNHRANAAPDDYEWRKILDDMDIRTWRLSKEIKREGKTAILIEPSYNVEIQAYVDETKEPFEESNKNAGYKLLLLKVEKKETQISVEQWKEIYQYYVALTGLKFYEHVPGLLAVIGIKEVWQHLTLEEKEWCVTIVIQSTNKLIEKQYKPYNFSFDISPFDNDAVLSVVPLLISLPELNESREQIEMLIVTLLITHFQLNDTAYKKFLNSFEENLWVLSPETAIKFFNGTLAFAKFTKANPFYIDHPYTSEQNRAYSKKLNSFTKKMLKGKTDVVFDEINFTDFSKWIILKVISLVPNINPSSECIAFLKKINDLYVEREGMGRRSGDYDSRVHEVRICLTEKLSNIIFWSIDTSGSELMEYLLSKINDRDILTKALHRDNEIFLFFRGIFKNLIIIADHNLPLDNAIKTQQTIATFEKIWLKFEEVLSKQKIPLFADLLLLEIEWNDSSVTWKPIENMTDFFKRNIKKYGLSRPQTVINLLSHIGDNQLLPNGINQLVEILKTTTESKLLFYYKYSEKLMNRIYENHLPEVKANRELLLNYLWLLDEMTNQGSSDSYWIREFLVSFK